MSSIVKAITGTAKSAVGSLLGQDQPVINVAPAQAPAATPTPAPAAAAAPAPEASKPSEETTTEASTAANRRGKKSVTINRVSGGGNGINV